jgi:hypothetical protein
MIKEIRFQNPPRHDSWGRNGFITTTGVEINSLGEPVEDRDATVLFTPISSKGRPATSCRVSVARAALPQVIAALESLLLEHHSCPPKEIRGQTTRYLVRWEIDIEAESPLEAAQKARHYQTKPDTTAQVFDVFAPIYDPPEPGSPQMRIARIDLTDPDASLDFASDDILRHSADLD